MGRKIYRDAGAEAAAETQLAEMGEAVNAAYEALKTSNPNITPACVLGAVEGLQKTFAHVADALTLPPARREGWLQKQAQAELASEPSAIRVEFADSKSIFIPNIIAASATLAARGAQAPMAQPLLDAMKNEILPAKPDLVQGFTYDAARKTFVENRAG